MGSLIFFRKYEIFSILFFKVFFPFQFDFLTSECETNMPAGDGHLVINLIMIELLGTVFFLALVTVSLYIKRYFVRKSLSGLKALVSDFLISTKTKSDSKA